LDLQVFVPPFNAELTQYLHVLMDQRGLAATTTTTYRNQLAMFLKWIGNRRSSLPEVTVADVTDYLNFKKRTCCARSIFTTAQPLKSFFAYGETQGWCVPNLAGVLSFPNRVRYDPDSVFPSWEDVRRILDEDVGNGPCDLRNRAMLLLCSVYGFRSSEVARLRLNDIDWRDETLTLTRSKNGRSQQFPLQYEVAAAILKYLIHGRPQCSWQNLFIRQHRPYRPVRPTVLNTVTAKRMAQLQIKSSKRGPHALRHACATQLLRTGSSLRQIADFLGHKGLTSVSIYARLDTEAMREVAAFSLKGVL
jgi:site-specific recombinase XerD